MTTIKAFFLFFPFYFCFYVCFLIKAVFFFFIRHNWASSYKMFKNSEFNVYRALRLRTVYALCLCIVDLFMRAHVYVCVCSGLSVCMCKFVCKYVSVPQTETTPRLLPKLFPSWILFLAPDEAIFPIDSAMQCK